MTKLLGLPGVSLPHKARFRRAFDLYVNLNIPFADAYDFTLMADLGLSTIYSFNEDFDRVPGVTRVEP